MSAQRRPPPPVAVSLSFDNTAPPLRQVSPSYLSVNVDTGSLFHPSFDWTSPALIAHTARLVRAAPMQLRIGGGAADSVLFTGRGGASGNCSGAAPGVDICVSAESWDAIMAFARATGVGIVWDLNAAFMRASSAAPWNSSNAAALLLHAADAASRGLGAPVAWQLGNEIEDWY